MALRQNRSRLHSLENEDMYESKNRAKSKARTGHWYSVVRRVRTSTGTRPHASAQTTYISPNPKKGRLIHFILNYKARDRLYLLLSLLHNKSVQTHHRSRRAPPNLQGFGKLKGLQVCCDPQTTAFSRPRSHMILARINWQIEVLETPGELTGLYLPRSIVEGGSRPLSTSCFIAHRLRTIKEKVGKVFRGCFRLKYYLWWVCIYMTAARFLRVHLEYGKGGPAKFADTNRE